MPHHHDIKIAGKVTDVFGHRFVLKTPKGTMLADIGPEAAERITLEFDDPVEIEGEQKPTEIKVHRISVDGAPAVDAHHGPKHKAHQEMHGFTAETARRIAEKQGFKINGELTPHKKHYEATAEHDGTHHVIHVHQDHIMVKYEVE